jgi:hypothetical protein
MGARAAIDTIMRNHVGDQGDLSKTLEMFFQQGFVSKLQKESLAQVIKAGNAAIHQTWNPTRAQINVLLDVCESLVASLYLHHPAAASMDIPSRVRLRKFRVIEGKDGTESGG